MEKEKILEPIKKILGKDKKLTIIMLLGFAGIALIFLSQFFGSSKKTAPTPTAENAPSAYTIKLEEDLSAFIGGIAGAGKTKVMVTLQNSGETLYLKTEKADFDRNGAVETGGFSERKTTSEDYVLVDGKEGRNTVITTTTEPEIRGVIIACEGGDKLAVQAVVLEAVTTALDISSSRVCITKLSS